jgi:hypothetical protein
MKTKKEKPEGYYASIKRRDPAARNNFQIFFLYPSSLPFDTIASLTGLDQAPS